MVVGIAVIVALLTGLTIYSLSRIDELEREVYRLKKYIYDKENWL